MAITKTITVLMQTQNNAKAPVVVNFIAEADVANGRLTAGHEVSNPGVYTAGTPQEGTSVNN